MLRIIFHYDEYVLRIIIFLCSYEFFLHVSGASSKDNVTRLINLQNLVLNRLFMAILFHVFLSF